MATLAETGLSENLGLDGRAEYAPEQYVAVVHNNFSDPFRLRYRQGSVFVVPVSAEMPDEAGKFVLDEPLGSTYPFKPARSLHLDPVFAQPYITYNQTHNASDVIAADNPDKAEVTDRQEIETMIKYHEDLRSRPPAYLFLGQESIRAFITSSLEILELGENNPLDHDKDGCMRLTGDDFIASRLIQLAGMSRTDVRASIPPAHLERALKEFVSSIFIHHYSKLDEIEDVDNWSGAWHFGSMRFAETYGVEVAEIADMALWLTPELTEAMQAQRARYRDERSSEIVALQPEVAARIAKYVAEGANPLANGFTSVMMGRS